MSGVDGWRPHLRRHRATLVVVVGFLLAVGVVVATSVGTTTSGALDPDNPGPDGTRALARVLDDEGVSVAVARGIDELEATSLSTGATVVVTSTQYLGGEVTDRLRAHVASARLVLVAPSTAVLDDLDLDLVSTGPTPGEEWRGDCADPRFDDLTLAVDRALAYRSKTDDGADDGAGAGCFASGDGAGLVESAGVSVFGPAEALTNEQITRADDAAVALRLLGQADQLVWYVPRYEDLSAGDGVSAQALLPRWIRPGLWLGGLTLLALVIWRARRLGPLSTEPLPVVVKAVETTLSRGRLYRRAGDRAHAANALRRATRARAAARLRLGGRVEERALVRDLALHTDRSEGDLHALVGLGATAPDSDRDLIRLANDLAALEEEVRRP